VEKDAEQLWLQEKEWQFERGRDGLHMSSLREYFRSKIPLSLYFGLLVLILEENEKLDGMVRNCLFKGSGFILIWRSKGHGA
jgi:hypothetical protein